MDSVSTVAFHFLHAVSVAAEPKLAVLHLVFVLLEFSGLLLLARKQSSVLLLARSALLDTAEGHEENKNPEDSEGSNDDTTLGTCGKCLPVVADA